MHLSERMEGIVMRNGILLSLAMLAAIAGRFCVVWFSPEEAGVTWAKFARIEKGMTKSEVEAILGGPPSYYSPSGKNYTLLSNGWVAWAGEDGAAGIVFDSQGRVDEKRWFSPSNGFLERMRRWYRQRQIPVAELPPSP
jgi:hypothetical protein